ncbi:MAG: Smr/MutS family protein [Bdellovibrionaceae bacterium]|nr:Smr/MutS family protein [Pseudobdellovibrionaceae bacterium]
MENLKPLDWNDILARLEKFATSEPARARLRELEPLDSAETAERSCREIQEAQSVLSGGERPFMESLDLFSTWFQRLKREAVLQTLELRDVRRFCLEAIALSEVLRPVNGTWVQSLKDRLLDATGPLSAIDQLMTPSGEIRNDASETLYHLYREKTSQTRALQAVLDKIVKAHEMETMLQDKYVTTREGRWVIPVKGGMQHHFPGIIHAQSQSKQTVFMEPDEVVPLNNRLRQIDAEIEEEIERLLLALSAYLRTQLSGFESSQVAMLDADIRLAQGKLADVLEATVPRFTEATMELQDVRHPLLVLKNEKVIPNSLKLDVERRLLLLSGPNAGGKTVLLKSVGLAAHMARCGLLICADEGSKLPFFKQLFVGVGDAQSVDAHLSTFAAHLKVLDEATKSRGPQSLLLIDEICGSTDPEEGSALARSFIERYANNHVLGVITSHLGPLKVGWTAESGVINGSLEYNAETGLPTYQFFMGVPGQSLALQTARRVGVDNSIVERAMDFLSPETKAQQQHLREIEATKEELQELRRRLQDDARDAREAKKKYLELIQNFRQEKDQWLERSVKKAEKKIDDMLEKAQVENVFRKHERLSEIKRDLPEVVKASTTIASPRRKVETAEDFAKLYPPGSIVFIPSVSQEGVVQGTANAKGEVPVLSNSMRLLVHWRELKPPHSAPNPTQNIVRRSAGVQVTLQDVERVIDVRGQRVEDAISQIEIALDAAALANEDRVKIIHGHGTDTLKKAIRSHLSRSVYVKKWKAAPPETGGDGVTWAELKD